MVRVKVEVKLLVGVLVLVTVKVAVLVLVLVNVNVDVGVDVFVRVGVFVKVLVLVKVLVKVGVPAEHPENWVPASPMEDIVALVPVGRVGLQAVMELVVTHWVAESSTASTQGPLPASGPQ